MQRKRRKKLKGNLINQLPWQEVVTEFSALEIISEDEIESIHHASLDVLERVGMKILHQDARKIFKDKYICVSTDCNKIKKIVEKEGLEVPFLRPKPLAQDSSTSEEVLLHAINWYRENNFTPKIIILLQPTSPLRTYIHIKEALDSYTNDLDMLVSVKQADSNPYYVLFEENKSGYLSKMIEKNFNRRQDCPDVWEYNGAIYIINVNSLEEKSFSGFTKIKTYVMDKISSIDIDDEVDFKLASYYLGKKY